MNSPWSKKGPTAGSALFLRAGGVRMGWDGVGWARNTGSGGNGPAASTWSRPGWPSGPAPSLHRRRGLRKGASGGRGEAGWACTDVSNTNQKKGAERDKGDETPDPFFEEMAASFL